MPKKYKEREFNYIFEEFDSIEEEEREQDSLAKLIVEVFTNPNHRIGEAKLIHLIIFASVVVISTLILLYFLTK